MSGEEFANFVRQNEAGFYRIAYSYVRSREDALDIVQDAVEKGLRKLPALRDPARIKPWFWRILVNESIDRIRRRRETEPADESLPAPDDAGGAGRGPCTLRRGRGSAAQAEDGHNPAVF